VGRPTQCLIVELLSISARPQWDPSFELTRALLFFVSPLRESDHCGP
jgi:hypothetical protein